MKRIRYTPDQIIRNQHIAAKLLNKVQTVVDVCCALSCQIGPITAGSSFTSG